MTNDEKIKLFEYFFNELSRLSDDVVVAYNDMVKYSKFRRRNDLSQNDPRWFYNYMISVFRYEIFRETMHNVLELLGFLKY